MCSAPLLQTKPVCFEGSVGPPTASPSATMTVHAFVFKTREMMAAKRFMFDCVNSLFTGEFL